MSPILDELGDAVRSAADAVGPSVVRIGRGGGRGCGVVLGDGLVATNAHNLRDRTTTVTFADGRSLQGELAAADVDGDLAVLRVDTAGAPAVQLSSAPAAVGDVVFAVARSAAGGTRVSFGTVSATERAFRGPRGRRIRGSLEHTAPLPRGSSGSPVVDAAGAVVGLSTHRIGDGFYLALPADEDLRARLDALATGKARRRPTLGVGLAPSSVARHLRRSVGLPERDGLLVRGVEDGGPAAEAGLAEGDLLVQAGDRPLTTVDDLYDVLDGVEAGGTLELTVVRGTEERVVVVTFPSEDDTTEPGAPG
jgi:S1-C subfamily serine protease